MNRTYNHLDYSQKRLIEPLLLERCSKETGYSRISADDAEASVVLSEGLLWTDLSFAVFAEAKTGMPVTVGNISGLRRALKLPARDPSKPKQEEPQEDLPLYDLNLAQMDIRALEDRVSEHDFVLSEARKDVVAVATLLKATDRKVDETDRWLTAVLDFLTRHYSPVFVDPRRATSDIKGQ